jgi:hypothetical protein
MLKKLINPSLFYKPDTTNFLSEIYNGKETKQVTKSYLNQFSSERLKTERKIRNTGYFFNFLLIALPLFVLLLILLAIKH